MTNKPIFSDESDYWSASDFEDQVAAVLISSFETKLRIQKGAHPNDQLSEKILTAARNIGPYIPSNSRVILSPDFRSNVGVFDLINDPLPDLGVTAIMPSERALQNWPNAYSASQFVRKADKLGTNWKRLTGGVLYEMFVIVADHKYLSGERKFFTVAKDGSVVSCEQIPPSDPSRYVFSRLSKEQIEKDQHEYMTDNSYTGSFALQQLADRRFSWCITAKERTAKVHLGCMKEEIKSLLYARSLPMTATGRKRPVLHLVEAHKRRMRNGTDVDIQPFLKGSQVLVMDGTEFSIKPPAVMKSEVNTRSQVKYF